MSCHLHSTTTRHPAMANFSAALSDLPASVMTDCLPWASQMTVSALRAFDLPLIDQSAPPEDIHTCFSTEDSPPLNSRRLLVASVPPEAFVSSLREIAEQQWNQGSRSVAVGGHKYPLSVLQYWTFAHEAHASQALWHKTWDQLTSKAHEDIDPDLVARARAVLGALVWRGSQTVRTITYPVETLSRFANPRAWLNDYNIDQMLSVLEDSLAGSGSQRPRFMYWAFTTKLLDAFQKRSYPEKQAARRSLLDIEAEAIQGSRTSHLCGIFNVEENHWVACVVENVEGALRILFGDPKRPGLAPNVDDLSDGSRPLRAIRWWLEQHGIKDVPCDPLDIPAQEGSWSCGTLSYNALAYHLAPNTFPLLDGSSSSAARARLELLLRVVDLSEKPSCAAAKRRRADGDGDMKTSSSSALASRKRPKKESPRGAKAGTDSDDSDDSLPSIHDLLQNQHKTKHVASSARGATVTKEAVSHAVGPKKAVQKPKVRHSAM